MKLQNHPRIAIDPAVCHGQPVVAGTRVIVSQLLGMLATGESRERILEDFPSIKNGDIDAALSFASDLSKFEDVSVLATS